MKRRTVLSLLPLSALLAACSNSSAQDVLGPSDAGAGPADRAPSDGSGGPAASDNGSSEVDPATGMPRSLASVRVSNLLDEASCEEVVGHLATAGISETQLTAFMEQVALFHRTVPTDSLVPSGWEPLQDPSARYDLGALSDALSTAGARMTNCRITSWTLLQDLISVAGGSAPDTSQLFMDLDQIGAGTPLFDGAVLDGFETLFGRIPTSSKKASEQHVKDITAYFGAQGVRFPTTGASLVTVFEHDTIDPQAYEFVGHVGVLVPAGHGLLFVEKLAFEAPYQAVLLESRQQLSDYLMHTYDSGPDVEYGRTLILENDHLIEGYRTLD